MLDKPFVGTRSTHEDCE